LGLGAIIRENQLLVLLPGAGTRHDTLFGNGVRSVRGVAVTRRSALPPGCLGHQEVKGDNMAAMKPRTGDGPLEVTKEGRGIVMRVPLEGGGRLVVEMTKDEANELSEALKTATG
jgi:hypothetical protein